MKCPKCGSKNVARILYGMPAFDKKLEEDLKNKKVMLGGCVVMPDEPNPKYYCNECGKEICFTRAYVDKPMPECLRFYQRGFGGEYRELEIERNGRACIVNGTFQGRLTEKDWLDLVFKLHEKCYISEWEERYSIPNGDGEWGLELGFSEREKRTYRGNALPPYWKELTSVFEGYLKK